MRRTHSNLDRFEVIRLVPPAGVLIVWTVMMFDSGGFRPETWLPAGIVLAGLLAASAAGQRRLLPSPGPSRTALLVLIAFTGWCFASILWSDAPGTTWRAADLLLVALLGAWTLALAPWRPRTADTLMLGFSAAAVTVCLAALLSALGASDLTSRFEDFRFTPPLDYSNTSAAFCFMAAIPALVAAARPGAPVAVKALGQGLATFLCVYALLPQSRGSILGGAAAVVILALVVPFRWRLALRAALLLVTVLIAAGPVLHVYTAAARPGQAHDALAGATAAIVVAAVAAMLAGAALALLETRLQPGRIALRRARLGGIAAAVVLVLGAGGLAMTQASAISGTLKDQWRSLSQPGIDYAGTDDASSSGRLISADPLERYDYWRVSADGFRGAPLWGMGAGGFEHRYAQERRYPKPSRYPHNLALKVAGDTGLVGTVLIVSFLVIVVVGLLRGARRHPAAERAVGAAGLAVLAYFAAHGLFDWLEVYPVLVGPALAFPLVALAVNARADHRLDRLEDGAASAQPGSGRARAAQSSRLAWVAAGLVALVVVGALLAPWLALRYRQRASDLWRAQPAVAYADLRRSADLDPLAPEPLVLQGVIGLTRGDLDIAGAGFRGALEREQAWLPHFGLAVLAAERGDRPTATAELVRARSLNRLDPVLRDAAPRVLAAEPVTPAELIRDVLVSPFVTAEKVS